MFKFAVIFLDQSPELILPSTEDIQTVVNEFNSYFTDQIDKIRKYMSDIVNCSLNSGNIEGAKLAHLTPLIKANSLDPTDLKNYRPISNLSCIGKLIERVALKRINDHMAQNNLQIPFQFAYKKDPFDQNCK